VRGRQRWRPLRFRGLVRTYVYIDGFNLYYGCLKRTPYLWLDLRALCRNLLRPSDRVERIKYFTARVSSRPGDPDQATRQQTYLRALATLAEVEIHFGTFLTNQRRLPRVVPPGTPPSTVLVWRTEEKGSDVNLASHLVSDAYEGLFQQAVVITNDSDLITPIRLVRERLGLPVGLINPQENPSMRLVRAASYVKQVRPGVLAVSQFPPTLTDATGNFTKPAGWP
jgi:uncharacterized LabA/DUF88 family protein